MTSNKKKQTAVILVIILIIPAAIGILFYANSSRALFRKDLQRFSEESYDSVLLAMHSPADYTSENFAVYLALNTLVSSYEMQSTDELGRYLETIFSSGNTVNNVFLLLDPCMIWDACGRNDSKWDESLQNSLFSFAVNHPDISFEILLPYQSLSYWLDADESVLESTLEVYSHFVEDAYEYANIRTFYMGFEDWVLANPDNYVSDFDANSEVTEKIFLTCFCDKTNEITPINGPILFDMLREFITDERISPSVYPDLSDCCLVFFGDSIMASGKGSYSIPGYITGFSGAVTYNYAIGGTSASTASSEGANFLNILPDFLANSCVEKNGTYYFSPEGADLAYKKLYFIPAFGTNDYFKGAALDNPDDPYDISTYKGSLRCFLKDYTALFPDAEFVLIAPGFTDYFSQGTEQRSDVGGILTDYVDAAVEVAEECNVYYIDNYHELGIDESNISDYSSDGCHPNEDGRMLIAKHIVDFLGTL